MPNPSPLGWHSRGYLPHLDAIGEIQTLTFRLGDSVPIHVVERWKGELGSLPDRKAQAALRARIEEYEDAGHGSCVLGQPEHAATVENAFLHFDGERYRLLEWVIMPNHVHVIIKPTADRLDRIVKSWKSFTASQINKALGERGSLWSRDYHDRYIRDEEHLAAARAYVWNNPVKAGLCKKPEDWRFGSAFRQQNTEPPGPV